MAYPTITMKELDRYIEGEEDFWLVDLRNRSAFRCCHICRAVNIPYEELENQLECLPKNKLLIFYCARGGQSMLACNHLSAMGYRVMNVGNGISLYRGKYLVRT